MSFKYRFQQLLQISIHEENEVKNRLAQKDGQIAAANAVVKKIKDEHARGLVQKGDDLRAGDMVKVRMYDSYFLRLRRTWEFHEEELERLHRQRGRIFEELVEKRKNRNTYEKIRERDEKAWKKEQQKKEQKRLDEFGNRMKKGSIENA